MTTAVDIRTRVDDLATRVRERRSARAKFIGPVRRVMYYGVTLDHLECGHHVWASSKPSKRRHCPKCGRGVGVVPGCQLEQAKRDGR